VDKHAIDKMIKSLTSSLMVRESVDEAPLRRLHKEGNYAGMLACIKKHMLLETNLRIGYVKSGGPANHTAWVHIPEAMPLFGTLAFRKATFTVFIRKKELERAPFGTLSVIMAHELSHLVLDAINHPLKRVEKAVDLTAMLLGYRDMFVNYSIVEYTTTTEGFIPSLLRLIGQDDTAAVTTTHYGYLTSEERHYARRVMDSL